MARLTVRRGPDPGTVYELTGDEITIGRSPQNTIVINDDQVSRTHLRLLRVSEDYELHDMGSSNGTFIDGQRISGNRMLPPVCLIELGDSITLAYERTVSSAGVHAADGRGDDRLFLVVSLGTETERIYALESDTISIGRDLSNDIVLPDPEVSRWHLQLQRQGSGYILKDLGSTNGTIVNGMRLTGARALTLYDAVEVGSSARLYYVRHPQEIHSSHGAQPAARDAGVSAGTERSKLETSEVNQSAILNITGKRKTSRLGTGLIQGALDDHVIVAYARDDWEQVIAPLTVALQDAGIDVWVDQYLKPGEDDWTAAVEQALTECWLMVVVVSPTAMESRHVKLEYRHFVNREKPVLLFVYEPVDRLPPELNNLEAIYFDSGNSGSSFRRLILEILHRRS